MLGWKNKDARFSSAMRDAIATLHKVAFMVKKIDS